MSIIGNADGKRHQGELSKKMTYLLMALYRFAMMAHGVRGAGFIWLFSFLGPIREKNECGWNAGKLELEYWNNGKLECWVFFY